MQQSIGIFASDHTCNRLVSCELVGSITLDRTVYGSLLFISNRLSCTNFLVIFNRILLFARYQEFIFAVLIGNDSSNYTTIFSSNRNDFTCYRLNT
ncbi:hypothetical protein D3C81_1223950 [compost metagenome]